MATKEFLQEHPFKFHLLRVIESDDLFPCLNHINSLFEGYNCTEKDITPCDEVRIKRVVCNTEKEAVEAIKSHNKKHKLYILTPDNYHNWKTINIS